METGVFPLYEVENGRHHITVDVSELKPVKDYLKLQGRFRHLSDDVIKTIEDRVRAEYARLKHLASDCMDYTSH